MSRTVAFGVACVGLLKNESGTVRGRFRGELCAGRPTLVLFDVQRSFLLTPKPCIYDNGTFTGVLRQVCKSVLLARVTYFSHRSTCRSTWLVAAVDSMEWTAKLRASYFVDVRTFREGESSIGPVSSMILDKPTVGPMAADTRPFEEIKRMRLSQALDSMPPDGPGLAIASSPTYATCAGAHFEAGRTTSRFSPGKGVNVSGTTSSRPTFGGGGLREMGFGRQPLSPALTAPPTPPPSRMDWKVHETGEREQDAYACAQPDGRAPFHTRTTEVDQGVLPLKERPLDEVNAAQALMSVGLGAMAQAAPTSVLEGEEDNTSIDTDSQAGMQVCEVCALSKVNYLQRFVYPEADAPCSIYVAPYADSKRRGYSMYVARDEVQTIPWMQR